MTADARRRAARIATGIGYALAFPVWALTRRSSGRVFAVACGLLAWWYVAERDRVGATLLLALAVLGWTIDATREIRELRRLVADRLSPPQDPRLLPAFARDFTGSALVEIRLPLRDAQPFLRDPVVLVPTEGQRPTAVRCDVLTWEVEQ